MRARRELDERAPGRRARIRRAAGAVQALVARMGDVITAQRNGVIDTRASRSRKRELRSELLRVPIAHLAQTGGLAAGGPRAGQDLPVPAGGRIAGGVPVGEPPATMLVEVLDYGLHAGFLALYEFGVNGTCSVPSGFIM